MLVSIPEHNLQFREAEAICSTSMPGGDSARFRLTGPRSRTDNLKRISTTRVTRHRQTVTFVRYLQFPATASKGFGPDSIATKSGSPQLAPCARWMAWLSQSNTAATCQRVVSDVG